MCGILGVLSPTEGDQRRFGRALQAIRHRGPDGEAVVQNADVLLGFQRLAIIDLSHDADQPMTDPETGAVIIYNGEIYNYLELRAELEQAGVRFRTQSDTEVLLKGYLHWGVDVLPRLNGMWAFAIWTPRDKTLFISRDRFGVKPFYYAETGGRLIFASEPKAILVLEPALAEPDHTALHAFFMRSESHTGARSFYRHIESLPPGAYAFMRPGSRRPAVGFYWSYPAAEATGQSSPDTDATLQELLEDAVRLRLRSDVPVGLTLSGGVDSSAILAATRQVSGARLQCFTSVYSSEQRGEERWAKLAAETVGAPLSSIENPLNGWHDTISQIIAHVESPTYSPAVLPLWAIMQAARRAGVPVLLEGQGADELLAGYASYAPAGVAGAFRSIADLPRAPATIARLAQAFGKKWLALWMLRSMFPTVYDVWRSVAGGQSLLTQDFQNATAKSPTAKVSPLNLYGQLQRDHSVQVLPALLHYGDAVSMAHGIESRLPFMDYRLVEWVFKTRPELIVGGETKAPLRQYLRRRGLERIAARRDKQGYPTPVGDWIRAEGGVYLHDVIGTPNAPVWDILDRRAVDRLLDRSITGDTAATFQVFKVVTTLIWLDQVRDRRLGNPASQAARSLGPVMQPLSMS